MPTTCRVSFALRGAVRQLFRDKRLVPHRLVRDRALVNSRGDGHRVKFLLRPGLLVIFDLVFLIRLAGRPRDQRRRAEARDVFAELDREGPGRAVRFFPGKETVDDPGAMPQFGNEVADGIEVHWPDVAIFKPDERTDHQGVRVGGHRVGRHGRNAAFRGGTKPGAGKTAEAREAKAQHCSR